MITRSALVKLDLLPGLEPDVSQSYHNRRVYLPLSSSERHAQTDLASPLVPLDSQHAVEAGDRRT